MTFKAHIFDTKEEAMQGIALLNSTHGLPVNGGISQFTAQDIEEKNDKYIIRFSEGWTEILGEAQDFEI